MEIDNLLENDNSKDDLLAFLSYYVPMAFSDTKISNQDAKINFREMNELIMKGPEGYVEPLCVEACKDLWKKNIYVLASINTKGDLYLILDKLNADNTKVFKNKYKQNPDNYCLNIGKGKYLGIKVENFEEKENVEQQFKDLVSDFEMQDIQRGYMTEKTFLMNVCNCEKVQGLTEYKKQDLEVVFDVEKMDKSFKEYLKDSIYADFYVPKEHRIYLNEYYYQAHINYLNNRKVTL